MKKLMAILMILIIVLSGVIPVFGQNADITKQVDALAAQYGATVVGTIPAGFDIQQAESALAEMARMRQQDESSLRSGEILVDEASTPSGEGIAMSQASSVTVSCDKVHSYGPVSKKQIIVSAVAQLHIPSNRFHSIGPAGYGLSGAWAIPFYINISDVNSLRSWIDNDGSRANVDAYYVVTTIFAGVLENQWTARCRGSKYA